MSRQLPEEEISMTIKYMKTWLISHQSHINKKKYEITFSIHKMGKNLEVRKQKGIGKVETPKRS